MRSRSAKRAAREAESQPARDALRDRVGRCEYCGRHNAGLQVHEILRGTGFRQKALDQPCAQLVLCHACHDIMGGRPLAEQLAILCRSRPGDMNLTRFYELSGRHDYPTRYDVNMWYKRLCFVPPMTYERIG